MYELLAAIPNRTEHSAQYELVVSGELSVLLNYYDILKAMYDNLRWVDIGDWRLRDDEGLHRIEEMRW